MSRSCTVCLHPRRNEAENLLRQGMSISRSAKEIGIGQAALHRHWRRHVANRYSMPVVGSVNVRNETGVAPLPVAEPEKMVPALTPICLSTATYPAGGRPFCWCARCQGRRDHYPV